MQSQLEKSKTDLKVICSDLDDDCKDVENKTLCWLYQPECGMCPFLNKPKDSNE